jgi:tetratricopeptide (TPR) repeat protein
LNALAQAGISVWRDETEIPEQASITSEIRQAIANCRAFLAFYSLTYPQSNPCQEEITTAWLAAQQIGELGNRRVWIVNPETNFEHIPELFRDQQSGAYGAETAPKMKQALESLDATLLGTGMHTLPAFHGMSPVQASRFAGRAKEFWDLHNKLTANRISIITGIHGQAAAQVRGLGGNGKSLLAREYAIRFGSAYPGGVFWSNAYGHDDTQAVIDPGQRKALLQTQIREFAIECGVPTEGLTPDEVEANFWRSIERRGERCLWIVDDVPSGLNSGEFEDLCRARWPGASTLATTRSREHGGLGSVLDLGVLSPTEALGLLCSHRQPTNSIEESAAGFIVELLGFHPLAVEVAGSYLALGVEGFEAYVEALKDPEEDALEFGQLLKESLPTGHERSISATLLKSIRQLGSEGLDFLRIASVLAVAPIPVNLLPDVFAIVYAADIGKSHSIRALSQVDALSLCERFGHDARTVHTLVSRTMRFQFRDDPRTAQLRSAAIQALSVRISVSHIGEHSTIATDLPHVRQIISTDSQDEDEVKLALCVARLDYQRGDYQRARALQENGLAVRRRLLGEDHRHTLAVANNLAETLYAQGDVGKARTLHQHVHDANVRLLGEEHPDTLGSMGNLAVTLNAQGDLAGAELLQRRVLAVCASRFGEENNKTLWAANNLAQTLRAQGNLTQALDLQEFVFRASHRTLGDEHPDTLKATTNLAETLRTLGKLREARAFLEEVLRVRRATHGDEHPDTLRATNNLALTLYAQGNLADARVLQERALSQSGRLLGDEHPDTLKAINNLAITLLSQGEVTGARVLLEDALATHLRLGRDEHVDALTVMEHLAQIRIAFGELEEASTLQKQALVARRRLLGEGHPDTLTAMGNLGQTLYAMGDLAEARPMQEFVLEARRNGFGEHHLATLAAMSNLAVTLYHQSELERACSLQEQTLHVSRDFLGEDHPTALTAMNNLAQTLYALGELTRARLLQERAVTGRRRVLGDEHPETVQAILNLDRMKLS